MINLFKKHREGFLYILFGAATTVSNWITYCICVELFQLGITVSNAIACFVAVSFAFVTNKIFVFRSRNKDAKTVIREAASFVASRGATGVIDIFAPELLIKIGLTATLFGIDGFFAKFVTSFAVIVLNYVLSKVFVFK